MFSSMNDREAEWPCQDSGLAAFHISEVTIFRARRKNSIERFSIAFMANGKRQAEISRLPKTREIYLVSAYILPVSHSYGTSAKTEK